MAFTIARTAEAQTLALEGAVTVRNAQELAAALGEGLHEGAPLVVDTQALEDIDTCILQMLCSLRKSVAELSFENPSDAFLCAVDRCGLRRELLNAREGL